MGLGDTISLDEDFDFWGYEASQHSEVLTVKDVRVEGAEDLVAGEDASLVDESETPPARPEFVVPKIKYTRESKGLKPTYRVFSKDRQTVPKPRINPYSVLMKMIDPANDDEYLDSDSTWQSPGELKGREGVAHVVDSTDLRYTRGARKDVYERAKDRQGVQGETSIDLRLEMSNLEQAMGNGLQGGEALVLEDGDIARNLKSDIVFGYVSSSDKGEDSGSPRGDKDKLQLPFPLLSTEDNIGGKKNELVTGFNDEMVRLSDIWSDSEDEEDAFDHVDDNSLDAHSGAESVKEDVADGEDPLRKFLNSRSGNRDSKQEGRVFKYNKAVRKPDGAPSSKPGLYGSGSLTPDKKVLHPASILVVNQGSERQTETSDMREVLQIAYNLPKNRVLEDYMAPFMNKFSIIQVNLILEALCGDDLIDQVLSFFNWMRLHDPCLWDTRSFSLLFTFLGRMGMPDQALVYFGMLPEDKQFHSVQVYNTLITCLTNCNRYD